MRSLRGSSSGPLSTAIAAALGILAAGCATVDPPQTVDEVDLERYMGVWYEIARFPVFFQRGLVGVTAEYTLESEGKVRVVNRGFRNTLQGRESSIRGYATVPDPKEPAKLRVRFDPFPARLFPGDYWVIDLDEDYEYAVVSNASRKVLWILSRSPSMDETQYEDIVGRLAQRGFDTDRLETTPQANGQASGQ